jgi:hypothetical protein
MVVLLNHIEFQGNIPISIYSIFLIIYSDSGDSISPTAAAAIRVHAGRVFNDTALVAHYMNEKPSGASTGFHP